MVFLQFFPRIFSLVSPKTSLRIMERVIANNKAAKQALHELQKEFEILKEQIIAKHVAEIQAENAALKRELEWKLQELSTLEHQAGRASVRVPFPGESPVQATPVSCSEPVAEPVKPAPQEVKFEAAAPPAVKKEQQPPKEKKAKPEKTAKQEKPAAEEAPIDIRRLDLRVGKIVEVSRHPDADALYLEKIDCGEPAPRTVISGLVKHVPIEEMQNRMVIVLCNLKPVKMRGISSEGMVMCASSPDKVEVLAPPAGAVPGDLVHCDGFPRLPDALMNPKKKIFETVAPDLLTNDTLEACYKGAKLQVPGKGPILAQTLKNVFVK